MHINLPHSLAHSVVLNGASGTVVIVESIAWKIFCANLYLRGNQFFDRILLFFMPQKFQPDYIYLRHVKLLKGELSLHPKVLTLSRNLFSTLVHNNPADMFRNSLCNQITQNCFNCISNNGCCYCRNKENFRFYTEIIFTAGAFLAR